MTMKAKTLLFTAALLSMSVQAQNYKYEQNNFSTENFNFDIKEGPVKPTAESIAEHYQCPEWFQNAKFGIYIHWGLNSVPGFDGHYARSMYWYEKPDSNLVKTGKTAFVSMKVYKYHVKHFGHPSKFGYKDFINIWKPTKFDANALAKLYKKVGARFIGVMACHHDNFDLYDSSHQPWNSVEMGPHLDVVGEWKKACRKHGLKFAVTSHLSNYWHEHIFYQGSNADPEGPYKGVPYDYMNPAYEGLYGKRTPDRLMRLQPEFAQSWYLRTKELVDKYQPDLIYFDGSLPNREYGIQFAAHYYNSKMKRGEQTGVVAIKHDVPGYTWDRECTGGQKSAAGSNPAMQQQPLIHRLADRLASLSPIPDNPD